jgi:hypothetical protein
MSEFIEFLSPSALSEMEKANAELVKMVANVKSVQTEMGKINTPSGGDAGVKQLTAQYDAQARAIQSLQQQIQKLQATNNALSASQRSVTTSGTNQKNTTRQQAVAQQILRAETDRNIRANTLLGGAYARASAQLLILKKTAKDYAIALGENHPKTLQAMKDAEGLSSRIMAADKSVGDFQRNVGNYGGVVSKGFKSLYSQVRTLAYILPGIGIGGIFGLALEPLYELIKNMDIFKERINAVKESKKQLDDINKEGVTSSAQELIGLRGNLEIAKDVNLSYKERMIAVKNLQDSYPFYFQNLTTEQILAGQTAAAENALTEAILSRAKANAAVSKITENQGKIIDFELQKIQLSKDLTQAKIQESRAFLYAQQATGQRSEFAAISAQTAVQRRVGLEKDIVNTQKEINELQKVNNTLTTFALGNQKKAIGLDYKDPNKGSGGAAKERTRLNYAEAESLYNLKIARLEEQRLLAESQMNNVDATDYGRLQARKEFSALSLQILDEQYAKEKALSDLKFKEDLDKANEIYRKNKKNGYDDIQNTQEWAKAIQDINNRHNNEIELADINHSKKFKDLMYSDAAFNEKILRERYEKDKKLRDKTYEETNKLNELINKAEQKKYQKIANDEKLTLKTRQQAFLVYQDLALRQLDIQKILELSKADSTEYDGIIQKYKELKDAIAEIESPLDKANEKTKAFIEGFQTEQLTNALKSFGLESAKMFLDFDSNGESTFSKLLAAAKTTGEEFAVTFNAIGEIAQSAFNTISEASQANFDDEYARLEEQKNVALAFAGDSASARAEIEEQYEQRRKQIAKREAKAKKSQAMVNIAIDTAQAIVATLAKTPLPAGLPFVIATAALGAAQLAMVASQQLPEYWKGTDNAEGGLAWTQERGREIITDSQGRIKSTGSDKGAELTMLSKGDKVFTAEKSAMMFDNSLNSMLLNNGIVMPKIDVSMDTKILGSKLDKLSDTIASKESFSIVRDAKGERIYQRKQNERKELLNNILNVKTYGI